MAPTPDTSAEARRLRLQGFQIAEIADRLGVAERTVYRWLSDAPPSPVVTPAPAPLEAAHAPPEPSPAAARAEVERLASEGVSRSEIARRTGVPRTTVRRWLAATSADAPPEPAPTPEATAGELGARDMAAAALEQATALSDRAQDHGDTLSSARANRAAIKAEGALERLESASPVEIGGISHTSEEWVAIVASATRKLFGMIAAAPPIRCAHCGCALSAVPKLAPESSTAPADPEPHNPEPSPALERVRRHYARGREIAVAAAAVGNYRAESRATSDMAESAAAAVRRELAASKRTGLITISREQAEKNADDMQARFAVLAGQPLMCPPCARRARIRMASDGEAEA